MTPDEPARAPHPTTDELLRLARKAFDGAACTMHEDEYTIGIGLLTGDELLALHTSAGNSREALHAALLVLAGELDVAELLAERDRLREERDFYMGEALRLRGCHV